MKKIAAMVVALAMAASVAGAGETVRYKVVEAEDIAVKPEKYKNVPIEMRDVHCLAADNIDYRCVTDDGVAVFGQLVLPIPEQDLLDRECDTVSKMDSDPCQRTIQFEPTEIVRDTVGDNHQRIVLKAVEIMIVNGTVSE